MPLSDHSAKPNCPVNATQSKTPLQLDWSEERWLHQYDIDPTGSTPGRFQFVVVDEMLSKADDENAKYALELFEQFGLQLLIVAPLDAKARVTETFVDTVHWKQVQLRDLGNNPKPNRLTIDTLEDMMRLAGRVEEFATTQDVVRPLRTELPGLSPWLVSHVPSVAGLAESLDGLIAITDYFVRHPWPDCFARQFPGAVDTKFVERHQAAIRQWLDILPPTPAIDVNETKFARRFGLRDGQQRSVASEQRSQPTDLLHASALNPTLTHLAARRPCSQHKRIPIRASVPRQSQRPRLTASIAHLAEVQYRATLHLSTIRLTTSTFFAPVHGETAC